jgi:outer membrane protein TolC
MVIHDEFGTSLTREICPDHCRKTLKRRLDVARNWRCTNAQVSQAGKRRALVRERRAEVSEAEEDLERTKEEVGVRIATIYNKLETTRAMVEVAREDLAARQENARLSEEQFKRGVLLTSQRDASHAQAMKAQAGFLEVSLDYLLTRDELTRTLGRTAP